jgi:hypothetical protein
MESTTMTTDEATARRQRPVAHWVSMPDGRGDRRLQMVWAVAGPLSALSQPMWSTVSLRNA